MDECGVKSIDLESNQIISQFLDDIIDHNFRSFTARTIVKNRKNKNISVITLSLSLSHTHTHTHTYIYIYIYISTKVYLMAEV